jgi:hypothetical protein
MMASAPAEIYFTDLIFQGVILPALGCAGSAELIVWYYHLVSRLKMSSPNDFVTERLFEFSTFLATVGELKNEGQWEKVIATVGGELRRLLRTNLREIGSITETGLAALLVKQGPTYWVPYKKLMLIALLKETADYTKSKGFPGTACAWNLMALHFLLEVRANNEVIAEYSHLLPTVHELVTSLRGFVIPVRTRLMLMRDYERDGEFSHAEDELFAAIDQNPSNINLLKAGLAFYERLQMKDEQVVVMGGLSREEIEKELAWLSRKVRKNGENRTCE